MWTAPRKGLLMSAMASRTSEQQESEDLQAMESGAGRAEQTGGADGEYATHDEHKPGMPGMLA